MANMRRDAGKEAYWRDVLAKQAASGLSVRAFCGQEQVKESALYAWRRTLRGRDATSGVPLEEPFVPVLLTQRATQEPSIELELAGGRVLRLPASISLERLAALVHALEARAAR
jgi:transposase-like protein